MTTDITADSEWCLKRNRFARCERAGQMQSAHNRGDILWPGPMPSAQAITGSKCKGHLCPRVLLNMRELPGTQWGQMAGTCVNPTSCVQKPQDSCPAAQKTNMDAGRTNTRLSITSDS